MQKLLTFFSKNISINAIFNDHSFNDTLTNDVVSFEQLGSDRRMCLVFHSNRYETTARAKMETT